MKKEYNFKELKEVSNPYKGNLKEDLNRHLSPDVIDYFKKMSRKSNIPYPKLINMYLQDCVQKKRNFPF